MSTLYFVDKEGLYGLQKLYDLFLYKKDTSTNVLSCDAKYKKMVMALYNEMFEAWQPEQIQTIIKKSNKLTDELISIYGDFTNDNWYNSLNYVDENAMDDLLVSVNM